MEKIKERDNKKDVEEKKVKNMKTNENIDWIEEIKKGKKLAEIEVFETYKDGTPDLRLCRWDSCNSRWGDRPLFTFVTMDWYYHPCDRLLDAGFFYKSFNTNGWKIIPIVSWMEYYKTVEDFLKKFPEVKDIFREYPAIPGGKVKIEFSSNGENIVTKGWAFFDGDYVKICDYEGNKWSLEPRNIDSIQEIEDKEVDSIQEVKDKGIEF